MKQYEEMERAVLNCFIIKPELLKTTKLTTKHFKKFNNFFNFMKTFYERTGSFDISLMKSACKNPNTALNYIAEIIDTTSVIGHFEDYEKRLLKLFTEYYGVEEVHKLEQKLYMREIDMVEFKNEFLKILGDDDNV